MEGNSLQQSFAALRQYFVGKDLHNNTANPAQLVIFAERAFKEGCRGVASECLELYFGLDPPINQFLIRAHLCRALTAATSNALPEERLQKAVECIITAVDIAKKSECYHFLVHNASVLLWQICRPHRKPGWMGMCVAGWQSVARAQEHCKEEDYSWRLDVLLALLQSQIDAGLREEAGKTCHSALALARKKVPDRLVDTLKLQVLYGLGEEKSVEKEMKSFPELPIFAKLYKLKHAISQCTVRQGELEPEIKNLLDATLSVKPTSKKTQSSSKLPQSPPLSPVSKAALLLEIAQVCVEQGLVELCGECMAALPGQVQSARLDLLKHTVTSQLNLLRHTHLPPYSRAAVEVREQTIAKLENCVIAAQRLGDQELVQHVGVILWGVCLPLLQPNLRIHLSHTLTTLASALEQVDSLQHGLRCAVHMELAKVCADQNHLQTALEHINKAQELDSECEWNEQLRWLEERLHLRSELYVTPPSPLQQATQILEQVRSSSECGTEEEMRAVLVKVGALLAPDQFRVALGDKKTERRALEEEQSDKEGVATARADNHGGQREGEKEDSGGKCENRDATHHSAPADGTAVGSVSSVGGDSEYSGVVGLEEGVDGEEVDREGKRGGEKWYEVMKEQVKSHKEDIGTDDDTDRCRLWADLAKLGRKCEVWDVAYVAAKFCLIYDDKRWTVEPVKTKVQPSKIGSKSKLQKTSSVSVNRSRSDASARTSSSTVLVNTQTSSTGPAVERETGRKRGRERLYRDLLRTLAETHCIHAECAVYQLKEGGNELGHGISPPPPSKGQQQVGTAESDKTLVAWPGQLSSDAYTSFLRAGELGCSLSETWLVSNVATYLYNYSHHMLQTGSLRPLVPVFRPLLASVVAARGCGANAQAIGADVVCRLSCIVAGGLVQTWMPSPPPDPGSLDPPSKSTAGAGGGRKSGRASGKKKGGGGETHLQVSPDAGPQLQEAMEVCERGLGAGGELTLATRATLLAVWVQCKQLLQQPISSKTLGVEKEAGDSDTAQCRAVVAVEMLSLMGNRIWDFPDCPSLNEAFELVCACQWSDVMLELELLTRIARLTLLQGNHSLVNECSSRALQSVQGDKEGGKRRRRDESAVQRERELLSCVCSLQGQALVAMPVGGGKVASSRAAMDAFRQSAKYGRAASSYHRALEASQHYWNTCRELISSPLDREAVQQPLRELLTILTSFLPKRTHGSVEQKQEDLALHVAMYNIVFQVYIDKGEWEEGLKAIEEAMSVTPRTIHRDLAEHKLVFRSKMGRNVDSDMVRFQEDPEEVRARLWFTVACSSTTPLQQLTAFQKTITTLTSCSHTWQKVDYLVAFSEWLYTHQCPVQDALSHLQWALTLLLQQEEGEGEEGEGAKEGEEEREEGEVARPVCVLEKAVCVHVMMAQLQGRGSQGHRESCLAAVAYCYLIWKATMESYASSLSVKCDVQLPTSVQQWTDFTLTDELRGYIKSSDSGNSMNRGSIRTPALTSHYLASLSDELCACGLHALALPVETLRLVAVDCLMGSRPASQLAHLRLASMCTAIGAKAAGEEHWKQAGPVYLNPEDLAQSHTEMCEHRQKQSVVARGESKRNDSKLEARPSPPPLLPSSPLPVSEKTLLREVWVQEAALLVKEGQYQTARELLREANTSAKVFGDGHTMAGVLMTQAALAAAEKRVGECIRWVCEAQSYPMRLDVWEDCMLLLLTVASHSTGHWEDCVTVVSDAVCSLSPELLRGNSNERSRVESTQATIRARMAALSAGILLDRNKNETRELERLCEELSAHTESLLHMGRSEEAAQAMLDHARLVLRCSTGSTVDTSGRANLLKAVELLQRAVSTLQSMLEDALSLCSLSDGLHHPVEGLLTEAQLELANALLLVSEQHVLGERQKRNQHQQKACIERMIDDFVQMSPQHNMAEECWNTVASVATERALAALTSIYTCSTVQSHTQLKANCAYSIGRALLLVSEHTSPDPPSQWCEGHTTVRTTPAAGAESSEGGGSMAVPLNQHSTLSLVMRREEASQAEFSEAESIQYLAKACQSLGQTLNLALKCGDKGLAEMAALKIVDTCGTCDAETTALHLALFQSCVASRHLFQLLCLVQSDPSESKQAALLQQHSELSHTNSSSPLLAAATAELDTYTCWQRLQVSEDHLDLLRNFPPHFRFLVLQHSHDKSQLYSAYLIPPQPPPPAPKKGQPPAITVSTQPVVSRVKVSTGDRECLLQMVDSMKRLQAQRLLKSGGAEPPPGTGMSLHFDNIRAEMDGYLSSALGPIAAAMREETTDSGLTVILLPDFDLLQMPLEALSLLKMDCVKSVARDFSLQMLYHRMKKFIVQDEEASKKKDKFQLQPSFLQANTTNFRYILDPRCELNSEEGKQQSGNILTQVHAFPKITSKWSGHSGGDTQDAMSSSQWYRILKECSGLLFFGTERLLVHLSPGQLVNLPMQECSVAVVMDHIQTLKSSLAQSKLDVHKSAEELQAEQSLQAASLLSLVGVNCLISRQWHSAVRSCADDMCNFIKQLLSEGVGIADMRWREIKDIQLQQNSDLSNGQELSTVETAHDHKDFSSVYNTVVYGLPHLTLNLPA